MKPASSAMMLFLLTITTSAVLAAQQAGPRRSPRAFLTAGLSLESTTMAVGAVRAGLEVPVGPVRPWAAYGAWLVGGWDCLPEHPGPCNPSGTQLEAGVDVIPPGARTALLPFAGAGVSLHKEDEVGRAAAPVFRVGADVQPWPWLAPRLMLEATRYPRVGMTFLFTGALRIGVPLR